MKKLFCFLTLSIFSTIQSQEYWECKKDGSIYCKRNFTCCKNKKSSYGYECEPMPEAVCCKNGGACPKNNICDDDNENRKCRPKNLMFLSNETNKEKILDSKNPIVKYIDTDSTSYELIITSFIEGMGLFGHISDNNQCLHYYDFFNEFMNLLSSLRNLKFDETLPKELQKIAQNVIDNKQIYVNEFTQCGILKENVNGVFKRFDEIINDPEYFNKFSTHSVLYLGQIRDSFEELKPLYEAKNWKELGLATGKFVRLVFLWDFDKKKK